MQKTPNPPCGGQTDTRYPSPRSSSVLAAFISAALLAGASHLCLTSSVGLDDQERWTWAAVGLPEGPDGDSARAWLDGAEFTGYVFRLGLKTGEGLT